METKTAQLFSIDEIIDILNKETLLDGEKYRPYFQSKQRKPDNLIDMERKLIVDGITERPDSFIIHKNFKTEEIEGIHVTFEVSTTGTGDFSKYLDDGKLSKNSRNAIMQDIFKGKLKLEFLED